MSLNMENILGAIKEAKGKSKKRNFAQAVELVINLQDVDPKKAENRIQELIELPNSAGKEGKICVIASGEMALKAKRAGANLVMNKRDLEALTGDKKKQKELGKIYDFFIAEAPLMPLVGRTLGAILGPRGKMPTPVPPTANIADQIKKHRKTVLLRMRSQPVLHCRVGDESMSDKEIAENTQAVVARIEGKLRRGIKNIRSIHLKTSMGPSVKVAM